VKQANSFNETVNFLDDLPLFSHLNEKSIQALAHSSHFQHVKNGEVLFLQSDPSDFSYVVRSGEIAIVLSSPDGRDMMINSMRPGDIFGELGVLTSRPRSTSAVARSDAKLLAIPAEAFLTIVDEEPALARRILKITAERLQRSGEREGALAFLDAQARLARLLLELEKEEKAKGYVTISQDELAHRTGLIRQTVAKVLGRWRRAGWLITGRGRILILNHDALAELENHLVI
jgi:CRP-like cAMP-binding protein